MVYVSEDTPYMKLLEPFLAKKKALAADAWGVDDTPVRHIFEPLREWMAQNVPALETKYPPMWKTRKHLFRIVRNCLMSEELCGEFASYFEGKSMEELDALARSFSYENCVQRKRLNEALQEDGRKSKLALH